MPGFSEGQERHKYNIIEYGSEKYRQQSRRLIVKQQRSKTMIPPPPPPPPHGGTSHYGPGPIGSEEGATSPEDLASCREALSQACRKLDFGKNQETELEGLLCLGSHLIGKDQGDSGTGTESQDGVPLCVQEIVDEITSSYPRRERLLAEAKEFPPPGQWGKAVHNSVLAGSLQKATTLAAEIASQRRDERISSDKKTPEQSANLIQAWKSAKRHAPQVWLQCLDERLKDLRAYHARHDADMMKSLSQAEDKEAVERAQALRAYKRARVVSDGCDLASTARAWWRPISSVEEDTEEIGNTAMMTGAEDSRYRPQEVLGKYLDLDQFSWVETIKSVMQKASGAEKNNFLSNFAYADFLQVLLDGLDKLPESAKLSTRKPYARMLAQMEHYLCDYLNRTMPLLDVKTHILDASKAAFTKEWSKNGGYLASWAPKPEEALFVVEGRSATAGGSDGTVADDSIDLQRFSDPEELEKSVGGDKLKVELTRLGLKSGGTPLDRAKRLLLTKGKDRSEWPRKIFMKGAFASRTNIEPNSSAGIKHERRIDVAQQEVLVTALLHQLRPNLESTLRRAERRQAQTLNEREQEIEEDLYGSVIVTKKKSDGDLDDDDDDDAPVYNPKNVPLDWDGRPIPYWLFKLHGLNHYYQCEICGGESYRGRRNFELHFADQKHTLGMKTLGIPNTKHFHGVTKIDDAKDLWKSLHQKLEDDNFDSSKQEEYEDSIGNVLSATQYEDLARQGLL